MQIITVRTLKATEAMCLLAGSEFTCLLTLGRDLLVKGMRSRAGVFPCTVRNEASFGIGQGEVGPFGLSRHNKCCVFVT
jgi:hypothetical protein